MGKCVEKVRIRVATYYSKKISFLDLGFEKYIFLMNRQKKETKLKSALAK